MADWQGLEKASLRGYVRARDADGLMQADTLRRAARVRGWEQPFRGVVRIGPSIDEPYGLLAAALQRVRSDAPGTVTACTQWTALWLHGLLARPPGLVYLTTNHARRSVALDRVKVRRSRTLRPEDVTEQQGLPVVTVPRLFCDLAGSVGQAALRGWLLDARQQALTTFAEVHEALDFAGRIRGRQLLRRLLVQLDGEGADSAFEDQARRRLEAEGFRPDADQAEVAVGERTLHIDIPFTAERVGIECHGFGYHAARKDLERDAARQSELNLTDWIILIMTWNDLGPGWPAFRDRLRRALDSRRSPVVGAEDRE
jgi:hypothetical protein